MAKPKYDFAGWATRNDLRCSDGRTIRRNAFKNDDGKRVPMIWNHQHNDPTAVLGHAILENRDSGVYAYCYFNDTDTGKVGREMVRHGDIGSLSIWANQLKQNGGDVLHGSIKEVSLVLAGANPGAKIEDVMAHSDDDDFEAYIWTGEEIDMAHSDEDSSDEQEDESDVQHADETPAKRSPEDIFKTLNEDQKNLYYVMATYFMQGGTAEHSDEDGEDFEGDLDESIEHADGKTVRDIFDSLNDEQKELFYGLIGTIAADAAEHSDESEGSEFADNNNEGDNSEMSHNVFDQTNPDEDKVLTHSEQMEIIKDGPRYGSLKESMLAHGITNIEYLFPEAKEIGGKAPRFIQHDNSWVKKVMNGVHKTPFSRIKTTFADITADEARAKGYIKGHKKEDEVFTLLKRITEPQTVYKKQSFDRDDVVDINDFDVVSYVKSEMRMMLEQEIARAILIGDGRRPMDNDKIKEDKIRSIWADDELYCIHYKVPVTTEDTDAKKAEMFIESVISSMESYEGSGNVDLYISKHMLTACMLLKDKVGRRMYESKSALADAMGVNSIIPIVQFTGAKRENSEGDNCDLMGILVDLADYTLGADKGGAVNMFEDFDIDYNKEKFLLETRLSGALTLPKSAVALEIVTPAGP